jgi:hypothetical protein
MVKIGTKSVVDERGKKHKLKPFEDNFHLVTLLKYLDERREVGATLLKKHKSESYRVVFGFKCRGISPILLDEDLLNVLERTEAFKDLIPRELLTLHFGIFIDDRQRQKELVSLMNQTTSPELQLLIGGSRKRVEELTESGVRKVNFLNLYVTYTVDAGTENTSDVFDKTLASLEKTWHQIIGSYEEIATLGVQEILLDAYKLGICRWERLLANQLGLIIEPMTVQEIWNEQKKRFNRDPDPRILQQVVIDVVKAEFDEQIHSEIHPLSYLIEEEVPDSKRAWIENKKQYTGVMLFADKPDGWPDEESQLRYLWNVLSKETVYDTEVIAQVQRGSSRLLKDKLQSLTKQAQSSAQLAAERNETDVGATLAAEKALDAQVALYENEEPLHMSIVTLIHRPSLRLLDRDCADFQSYFRRDGWLVREQEYAHRIWLETFPALNWDKLLTKPFNRRITFVTSEALGMMPLVCNRSLAQEGFELIAEEGGTPIFSNLYKEHFHMGIFGRTGAGKSVVASDLFVHALPHQIPITVLDFPRSDGTGSFDALCEYLPSLCGYVDIGDLKKGWNLFEPPNLKGLDRKTQQERFSDFKEYLLEILTIMVMGIKEKRGLLINEDLVRSLLLLALEAFYEDIEIRERFARAFLKGLNSLEWQNMPTLEDFIPFCSLERLRLSGAGEETLRVLNYIKVRFRYWRESRLGQLLSKPTTFASDAQMLVVALRNLNNEVDAAVMALLAYLGAIRRSLAFSVSIFFVDEAPILVEYDSIANLIGRLFANGRKSGIRVIFGSQGIGSLIRCAAADKIFDNMQVKLIGAIASKTIDDYVEVFNYPRWLIARNIDETFGINKVDRYSRWLYHEKGQLIPCRHYPSRELFALTANNAEETQLRREFWQKHSGNSVLALHEFANQFNRNHVA